MVQDITEMRSTTPGEQEPSTGVLKRSASTSMSAEETLVRVQEEAIVVDNTEDGQEKQSQVHISLTAAWNGQKYPILLPATSTIGDLKRQLAEVTQVQPLRQKLIGFVKGKLPNDDVVLDSLGLKADHAFMMIGTVEQKILQEPAIAELPEVVNDLDFDFLDYMPSDDRYRNDERNRRKLREYIDKTKITVFNDLRAGKKMLVLDLDYTLFDCKSTAGHISELARPGLHEMLTAVYAYYDICIWSQTSWKWLEMKITELGILTHSSYRIAFVMDRTSMFSITSTTRRVDGKPVKHEVKALDIIWTKFPDRYSAANTIHIDDVSRNFAMNPQSGLKISAFKNAPINRHKDRTLFPLTKYLLQLALVDDFRRLDHKNWKSFSGQLPSNIPDMSFPPEWGSNWGAFGGSGS
ncbi:HAD hydrolase, family IIID [Spizellomyces punctatus DAOM BR117]|uniref:protein-serine/threonine phosphatase n=1 Tax=Spizellomyces punctatus (strain DAOM BR117) TaxID=645134 RepID=A0A0L0H5D9_SPIPD|nr:HAD hydrolase, family IIID [Spizellomyces punctatus DAOM BR117]KNC96111.1 HAD hydrolase, family IIID [Spizellomyces punctatus DAOM BR117]|eukprot:XP_016604151.1 HAD hydrolase, family IIID [Spizellomyces punctatus DAOM BR117]